MTPAQSTRLVRQFRRRIGATHRELAELWECDYAEVIAAETGGKSQQWIVDRLWFFTGLDAMLFAQYINVPDSLRVKTHMVYRDMLNQLARNLESERKAKK